ncbi:phage tail tip lysozyme [Brucella sp. 10RB9213]|uniref:phage tail tip lysozyme n=1 Tax=Brucella sp. 10RB9213 TaxID=1844039 RepID=UPI00189EDC73|nr:phage tail tip lysozyme [Brucella sp. 10RB9213]
MAKNNPNVRIAYDFFSRRGYSAAQTAGILGNLLGESELNPNIRGDGGKAYGIAQWHPDRWEPLAAKAREKGWGDPHDFQTQLEMVDWELRNKETRPLANLMKAKTVDEATAAMIGFERPFNFTWANPRGGHNYSGRLSRANEVFGLLNGVTPQSPERLTFNNPGEGQPQTDYVVGNSGGSVNTSDTTQPNLPFNNAELREQEAQRRADAEDVGLWQAAKDAVNTEWSLSTIWKYQGGPKEDPNFMMDQQRFDDLTKGLPEQYWNRFEDALSDEHAQQIRTSLEKQLAAEQRLASLGGYGTALRMGAGLTDPLAWAAAAGVSVASAGLGAPAAIGARLGRVGMIGLTAAEAGVGTAASEAVLQAGKPTAELSDFYWTVGMGMGLGGAFGALRRNPATAYEANQFEVIGKELRNSAAMPSGGSTAGAAQVSARETLRSDTADFIRDAVRPETFGGKFRFDVAASLKTNPNDLVAMVGEHIVEDAGRNTKGITPIGASEVQQQLQLRADAKWSASSLASWKQYAKRNPDKTRDDFNREVVAFARDRELMVDYDPAVKAQGSVMRDLLGDWAEVAANPGKIDGRTMRPVRGFEGQTRNDFYVPRIFDLGAVQNALSTYGHRTLAKLIGAGIREVNKDISAEAAEKFAYGYVKKVHSVSAGELQTNSRAFSGEDLELLKDNLRKDTDLSDVDIDAIVNHMKPGKKDGASRHGKARALYDEDFGMKIPRSDGTGHDFFRISDLFVNDADSLMRGYNRQMSGRVAMARMQIRNPKWKEGDLTDEFFVDGITSDGEWLKLKDQMRDVGDAKGHQSETKQALKQLDWIYDTVVGKPHWEEGGKWNTFLRMTRDYNFIRVMGQVGWSMLSEGVNTVSHLGVKAAFTNMPTLRSFWRNARTGKLDDALAQEVEDITSLGTDWVRHDTHRRTDLFDNPLDTIQNKYVRGIDDALQKGKRGVSALSGMAPINTILQRWTGRAIFNRFAQMAQGGQRMSTRRLEALGLTSADSEAILQSIRDHATFDGKRLKAMNFSKWSDRDAVAKFESAAFRLGRTIIQENDLGQMAMWMSKPLSRTFLQFRSFMLAAYSKQLMQGLNFHDATTAMSFIGTTVAASLVYIARTHTNSLGRSDRNEYLEKQLTLGRIAAAGVQYSSWASIMPAVWDSTIAPPLGFGPFFDNRASQLGSDAITGNPSADLLAGVYKALDTFGQNVARGKTFSQADARNYLRLLAFNNLSGISQLSSLLISPLPEWSRKR